MIGQYAGHEHYTEASGDPSPCRTRQTPVEQAGGYASPAALRHAEMMQRQAEDAARDRYQVPETRGELLTMKSSDQVRTYHEHRDIYDRLMGGAA